MMFPLFLLVNILSNDAEFNESIYEHSKFTQEIGYRHGRPTFISLARIPGDDLDEKKMYLVVDARDAWIDLMIAAAQDGFFIKVNYAFRTQAQQMALARQNRRLASVPGWSPHQQGLALDLSDCVKMVRNKKGKKVAIKTPMFYWLKKNATRFGFANTIRYEPWHWEYILPLSNANS